ncbi:MAG TPA: HK97 gp10 family phage protein [Methylophilaceae bacterium]|nr:HK97 gp10 family phage protein [Methylophilaceae bacterium]
MSTNTAFRRDIDKFIRKSKDATDDFVRAVVLNIDQRVVLKSPVRSGRFRNNWNVGNGSIDTGTNEGVDPSGSAQIAKAAAELQSISINGQTIYVTNSLVYSYRLEYEGWSKQAPNGMVRITLAEINSVMKDAAFEVKR